MQNNWNNADWIQRLCAIVFGASDEYVSGLCKARADTRRDPSSALSGLSRIRTEVRKRTRLRSN